MKVQKTKYNFYLSPWEQYAWTKCPSCDNKTKVRKFCLMVHYKKHNNKVQQMISLNKSCKYCPECDLLIVRKPETDKLMKELVLKKFGLKCSPDEYMIFGTMDRKDWKANQKEAMGVKNLFDKIYLFKDIWDFDIQHAGWYFDG